MKYMKMAAIAMMAFALFSCNNKKNEPKCEDAVLSIRIDDAELRALEGPVADKSTTTVTENVVLTLQPSGRKLTLTDVQIEAAKKPEGVQIPVGEVVEKVSLTANMAMTEDILAFQKMNGTTPTFGTKIPLSADETATTSRQDGDNTIYSVTLQPKASLTRLEVAGKIVGQANANGKNAYTDISVETVYINNYWNKLADQNRYFTEGDGASGFKTTPAIQDDMKDDVTADKEAFEKKEKVAGYQLFPKKADETAGAEFFDHVILKITITYSADAQKAGYPAKATRFVTMVKFFEKTSGDLESFAAGKIYKLDLAELSKDFKTDEDGKPVDPSTPDPEPKGDKILEVKVLPYVWTAVNIKPDVYKK